MLVWCVVCSDHHQLVDDEKALSPVAEIIKVRVYFESVVSLEAVADALDAEMGTGRKQAAELVTTCST